MMWIVFLANIMFVEVVHVALGRGRDDSKIVGGNFVWDIRKMPWIIDILNNTFGVGHICGGSLLTPVFVLTACHCLSPVSENESEPSLPEDETTYLFVAGSLFSGNKKKDKHAQSRRAKNFIIHPKCRELDDIMRFDFGIAVMKKPFEENYYVRPINILSLDGKEFTKKMYRMFANNRTNCYVAGWGEVRRGDLRAHDRGVMSKKLKMIRMYPITEKKCKELFGRENNRFQNWNFRKYQQICAVGKRGWGSDCQGDSGGPFVCGSYQVGLVSYGMDCGISLPAIYAGLGIFFEWFSDQVIPVYALNSKKVSEARERTASSVPHVRKPHLTAYMTLYIILGLRNKQLAVTS